MDAICCDDHERNARSTALDALLNLYSSTVWLTKISQKSPSQHFLCPPNRTKIASFSRTLNKVTPPLHVNFEDFCLPQSIHPLFGRLYFHKVTDTVDGSEIRRSPPFACLYKTLQIMGYSLPTSTGEFSRNSEKPSTIPKCSM